MKEQRSPAAPAAPPVIPAGRKPRRFLWLAAGVLLAVLVGAGAPRLLALSRPKPWSAEDNRMSFAVRPLSANQDDPALADYATALADDLTAGLSSVPAIGAILPRSKVISVDLAGGPDVVGRRLHVAYLIEGTVRRQGTEYQTSLSIINVATGAVLGTERLVEPVGLSPNPFREALTRTVATLAGYGTTAELGRIRELPEDRRDVRDLFILTEASSIWTNAEEGANEIVALSEKAVALAPDEPHAVALLADGLAYRAVNGWAAHPAEDMKRAESLADRVLAKDPQNLVALRAQLLITLDQRRDEQGIAIADRIIDIFPYGRSAYHNKALALMRLGRGEEALATFMKTPHDSNDASPETQQLLGEVHIMLGRYAEAAQYLRTAMVGLAPDQYKDANSAGILVELAAAEILQGRLDRAKQVLSDFLAANPDVATISAVRRQQFYLMDLNPATTDLILNSLRKAGMPD
jgi:tetratricopeptide (TPR) repeat protein